MTWGHVTAIAVRALEPEAAEGDERGTPDPVKSAKEAGLRYVSDDRPGIRHRRAGQGFRYLRPDGSAVRDEPRLKRITSLVIPLAWTDVWIATDPRGHIRALGHALKAATQADSALSPDEAA